jgi:uncharacterized protein (DUF433 family)
MATPKLYETGIFTVSEAADLVGATERRVRGWITGYPNGAAPIIDNELGWMDGRLAFSFTNLMEIRFLAFFVSAGVRVRHIRAIMSEAKALLGHPHPFATETVFKTDGKKIVAEIGRRNGVKKIFDLKSKNFEMREIVLESLKDDVEYDPVGDAMLWRPRPRLAPNVIIHPKFSFGRPVIRRGGIPTHTLADAARTEGSAQAAADWFELPVQFVREAVRFERDLRKAA